MEKIVIAGATGTIGKELVEALKAKYSLTIITRDTNKAGAIFGNGHKYLSWDNFNEITMAISGAYGVINLAGSNIGAKRWSAKTKKDIIKSRVDAGTLLAKSIFECGIKPKVFVQASAIGYYTHSLTDTYNESSICRNESFLHKVTKLWEASSKDVQNLKVRHVVVRLGVVMDTDNGALPRIFKSFKYGVGGNIGRGKQWVSWIHKTDVVAALIFLLENKKFKGIYNLTSPNPVRYSELTKAVSKATGFPSWLYIPPIMLKLIFGEMARETILSSQKTMPDRLMGMGYAFTFPDIDAALKNLLADKPDAEPKQ